MSTKELTIDMAYSWLNIHEGRYLRPYVRRFMEGVRQAVQKTSQAIETQNVQELEYIVEQIDADYETLQKRQPYLTEGFRKLAPQLSQTIYKKDRKSIDALIEQLSHSGGSHLAPSASDLVLCLCDGVSSEDVSGKQQAWQAIRSLESIGKKLPDHMEAAEALVECGYAAYQLGNSEEAVRLLQTAIKKYHVARHQIAMTEWMLGCVMWSMPRTRDEAFLKLRSSIDRFEFLAGHESFGPEHTPWYQERCSDMRITLGELVKIHTITTKGTPTLTDTHPSPSSTHLPESLSPIPTQAPPSTISQSINQPIWVEDFLRAFSIVESIPAGGFGPTGINHKRADDYVDISLVNINDNPHRVKNLRGKGKMVNLLSSGHQYMVIKITGNSMNKDDIDIGDYVLLRQQEDASNNDIVAAEIVGTDSEATLKRFIRRGNKIILRPNSTEPEYQKDHQFEKTSEDFYIRGVAYAVFKPLEPNTKSE